jgi:hypothetical protein
MKNRKLRPLVLTILTLTALFIGSCGGGGSSDNHSAPPTEINNCTGGPMQGTWMILVKWDNGDKNFNGVYKVCEDGDDLTFYNQCANDDETGYGLIRGQQITIIIRGTTAYEGTLSGNTITVPLVNAQGVHGTKYIIKKSTTFITPVGELKLQGTYDGDTINFIQNPSCAVEKITSQGGRSYDIGSMGYKNTTYTFTWVNPNPPTAVKPYTLPTDSSAYFYPGNSTNAPTIAVQSGTLGVTRYQERYSGADAGIEGVFDFTLSGGKGQIHGSFKMPFFGQETDPFANLP